MPPSIQALTGGDTGAPATALPEPGQLVTVRDQQWVVAEVSRGAIPKDVLDGPANARTLVTLVPVGDDTFGDDSVSVIWELEPGRRIIEHALLPEPNPDRFDDPVRLDAFLDAVRWGAITSADSRALQAPFRSGITIEDYQLAPVAMTLRRPRVNLLIADDVGLGKTIEAGLVVQELLLRHRARTVLVVCPASLTVKWRDEMAEKFGLEFRIVDSDLVKDLRRRRGLYASPWTHFPRLIVSIDWLKRERPMRLMREAFRTDGRFQRTFDLLIVDEAHTVAPSGRGKYATDSQRTSAVRTIAPHFEHRLFVTATPHNGYAESFSALLELLDDNRFARGVKPTRDQLGQVMIRRLKNELPPLEDGTPRFPTRDIEPLEIEYTDEEREVHGLLVDYAASRMKDSGKDERAGLADRFVLTLLKKRFFSSPVAFGRTLGVHLETASGGRPASSSPAPPRVLRERFDAVQADFEDEHEQDEVTKDALTTAARSTASLTDQQRGLIERMQAWASAAEGRADSKVAGLLEWLTNEGVISIATDDTIGWSDQRAIVFTEYRDTQRYIQDMLAARGVEGDRIALIYGGMDEDERERIQKEFQADPALSPIRLLLATDAASEGIDLQRHCHRLLHWEIPWNPNRLEQRNGRIDRHGQPSDEVRIRHFIGKGWEDADPGTLEGDLEFLHQAVLKVEEIREDLGSVGPVIADQVEEAMLGARRLLDTSAEEKAAIKRKPLKLERDLREEISRLHEQLLETREELDLLPANVERAVAVALDVAHQRPLQVAELKRPISDPSPKGPVFTLGALTGSWARCTEGLAHPVTGEIRPITFDHEVAAEHDDVVLVHLQHRLVQHALQLLRAEIFSTTPRLDRVTARPVPKEASDTPALVAHGRLVITGADGRRLHEEVIQVAGLVKNQKLGPLNVGETEALIEAASPDPAPEDTYRSLADQWTKLRGPLLTALERRARDRAESLGKKLAAKEDEEKEAITAALTELKAQIESELKAPEPEQLALFSTDEREQLTRDIEALRRRVERIPQDIEAETAAIERRYADPEPRLFPAAVTFLIPEGWSA
jgi:SNF2 family DNA or RNA helicase